MLQERRPWVFAAVCVMVTTLTLLFYGVTQVPVIELLPWYIASYLLIGACIFVPTGKWPSLRQVLVFLLPGVVLVVLAALGLGFWCGGWLLALPAWGLLITRWTQEKPLAVTQVLKLLGLWVLGLVIFMLNGVLPIIFLAAFFVFLLPLIPLVRLAYAADYRARPVEVTVDILLAAGAIVVALAIPVPEGSWTSPWTHAGGAATAGLISLTGQREKPAGQSAAASPTVGSCCRQRSEALQGTSAGAPARTPVKLLQRRLKPSGEVVQGLAPFRLVGVVPQLGKFGFLPSHPADRFQGQFHVFGREFGAVGGHPRCHVLRQVALRVSLTG
nr:hypothetical protein [Arthrobacter nitrophenolicus]